MAQLKNPMIPVAQSCARVAGISDRTIGLEVVVPRNDVAARNILASIPPCSCV